MTSSAALTAAKAAAAATSADLEAIAHRLEAATAAHAEASAELSAVITADAAGEKDADAHGVAVLRSELDLRAARVGALKDNHAKATEANRQARFRLRAESLKADKSILSTAAVNALVANATDGVAAILRELAQKLSEGNVANAAAIAEAYELGKAGALDAGLQIAGATQAPSLAINGAQVVDYIHISARLEEIGKKAAAVVMEELAAPRQAELAAKFAADSARDAKYAAERRAMAERNGSRIDLGAL